MLTQGLFAAYKSVSEMLINLFKWNSLKNLTVRYDGPSRI